MGKQQLHVALILSPKPHAPSCTILHRFSRRPKAMREKLDTKAAAALWAIAANVFLFLP